MGAPSSDPENSKDITPRQEAGEKALKRTSIGANPKQQTRRTRLLTAVKLPKFTKEPNESKSR